MKTFKTNDAKLRQAAENIREGNAQAAAAKKLVDGGKAAIAEWLRTERQVEVKTLPVGEIVNIDGVCMIEIGKLTQFDAGAFQLAHPEQHAAFKRELPVVKYKPLV